MVVKNSRYVTDFARVGLILGVVRIRRRAKAVRLLKRCKLSAESRHVIENKKLSIKPGFRPGIPDVGGGRQPPRAAVPNSRPALAISGALPQGLRLSTGFGSALGFSDIKWNEPANSAIHVRILLEVESRKPEYEIIGGSPGLSGGGIG
jgi:hypothetical protein